MRCLDLNQTFQGLKKFDSTISSISFVIFYVSIFETFDKYFFYFKTRHVLSFVFYIIFIYIYDENTIINEKL